MDKPQEERPSGFQRFKHWLLKRADNHKDNLQLLIIGAGIFFSGAGIIVWANQALPSSIKQELLALTGFALLIGGGITALLGYLGLSILRLIRFFNDKS